MTWPAGDSPDGTDKAFREITGAPGAAVTGPVEPARAVARSVAGIVMLAAGLVTALTVRFATSEVVHASAVAAAVPYVLAGLVLLAGRGETGDGLAISVGVFGMALDVPLLSFESTDTYLLMALAGGVAGLVAAIIVARGRRSTRRSGVAAWWSLAGMVAVVGTLVAINLPWYRIATLDGAFEVSCCPAYRSTGWGLVGTIVELVALVALLVPAASSRPSAYNVGVYLGVSVTGLASMVPPVYSGLTFEGASVEPGGWVAVGFLALPLLAVVVAFARHRQPADATGPGVWPSPG